MPIYEYQCNVCGSSFEKMTTIPNRDTVVCDCGNIAHREFSRVARVWAPTRAGQ
jgi:putative FmdB family regulatory protein